MHQNQIDRRYIDPGLIEMFYHLECCCWFRTFSVGDGNIVLPATAMGRVTVAVCDATIDRVCCTIADGVAITKRKRLA